MLGGGLQIAGRRMAALTPSPKVAMALPRRRTNHFATGTDVMGESPRDARPVMPMTKNHRKNLLTCINEA